MLGLIILFSILGGVVSLAGGVALLKKKSWSHESMLVMISFAAGVLLSVSFSDLLPEAVEAAEAAGMEIGSLFGVTLAAMAGFFLFERSLVWFHHHHQPHRDQPNPVVAMVWLGDTLHNAIDGLVITAGFFVSVPLGITTALAVGAHELPQEIADFSLYLAKGVGKAKTLVLNVLSSVATVLAAVAAYFLWDKISGWQPQMLAFTAGMFIYIAGSDLIPELHTEYRRKRALVQSAAFGGGIMAILLAGKLFGV
jgi:zinc and cadmium transporter